MSIIEKVVDKLSSERLGEFQDKPENDSPLEEAIEALQLDPSSNERPQVEGADQIEVATQTLPDEDLTSPAPEIPKHVDIRISDLELEGILSSEGGRTRLDEEYRMIKRPLLVKAFSGARSSTGRQPNLIMVTSALSGEGKTFTTINLAISIAMEMDRTVLLVDSDLAKPSLSRQLQISDHPGFTECLKDKNLDMGQFMLRTDVQTLTVLPAGKRNNRATELLASRTMSSRLTELATRYPDRIILFDSPPLLATSEASVLASHMGQVTLVVEYGATPQFLVKEALNLLKPREDVSLILNKTRDDFLIRLGGYGYGYGKGYGYGTYGDR